MAVKVLSTKADDPSLISSTHMMKEKTDPSCLLSYTHTIINNKNSTHLSFFLISTVVFRDKSLAVSTAIQYELFCIYRNSFVNVVLEGLAFLFILLSVPTHLPEQVCSVVYNI